MKAEKITTSITVETLSKDSVPGLICEASRLMTGETIEGQLVKDDGDSITWKRETKPVEF